MRSGHLTVPEWKQFIHLGEQLLKLPDVDERCVFIENAVQERLSCAAKLWLVEPLYPLPGENEIDTIPSTPVEKIVEDGVDDALGKAEEDHGSHEEEKITADSPGMSRPRQ